MKNVLTIGLLTAGVAAGAAGTRLAALAGTAQGAAAQSDPMTVGIEAIWSMKDNLPDVIVVLTDGGTDWPAEEGPVPVVAAIIPQGNGTYAERYAENVPDWIHTIVVEPAEDPALVAA